MNAIKNYRTYGLAALISACAWASVTASKPVPPPAPSSLVGAWFGFDNDRVIFCRLELDENGTGFCVTIDADRSTALYRIRKWSLHGSDLDLDPAPIDKDAEAISLKGAAGEPELILQMGGLGAKWKRELRLLNERRTLTRNTSAGDRIAGYKAAHPKEEK